MEESRRCDIHRIHSPRTTTKTTKTSLSLSGTNVRMDGRTSIWTGGTTWGVTAKTRETWIGRRIRAHWLCRTRCVGGLDGLALVKQNRFAEDLVFWMRNVGRMFVLGEGKAQGEKAKAPLRGDGMRFWRRGISHLRSWTWCIFEINLWKLFCSQNTVPQTQYIWGNSKYYYIFFTLLPWNIVI